MFNKTITTKRSKTRSKNLFQPDLHIVILNNWIILILISHDVQFLNQYCKNKLTFSKWMGIIKLYYYVSTLTNIYINKTKTNIIIICITVTGLVRTFLYPMLDSRLLRHRSIHLPNVSFYILFQNIFFFVSLRRSLTDITINAKIIQRLNDITIFARIFQCFIVFFIYIT